MATKKKKTGMHPFHKGLLGIKLRLPTGVTLNDSEAAYIINGWENERSKVRNKQVSLLQTSKLIEQHIERINREIPLAAKEVRSARGQYKRTKNPVAKRKWARKLLVRAKYHESLRTTYHSLSSTVDRVKDAVDDAQYVYKTLENRIAEAKIYRELNGGLKLVGNALMEARTKHLLPEVEYQNLEFTLESIEKGVGHMDDQKLLSEAEQVVSKYTADAPAPKEQP